MSAARTLHQRHHVRGALRHVSIEPLPEQIRDFQGQTQQHVTSVRGASRRHALQDRLQLAVIDRRDDRRGKHPDRHPCLPQQADSLQARSGAVTSLIGIGSDHRFLLSHIHDSVSQSVIPEDGLPPDWQERCSNRSNLLRHATRYLPVLAQASEVGSWWVTRAVGAFARDFDARPTVVTSHGFGCWSVLGGKIITCVSNAREIVRSILAEQGIEAAAHAD